MKVVERIDDLRHLLDDARAEAWATRHPQTPSTAVVGFVPTMGFFHDGHRSLMRAAAAAHDVVAVSLFVNPIQFGANEDLSGYPRDLERDIAVCEAEGVDFLFAPSVDEMYPGGAPLTGVAVADLSEGMCGVGRPIHFGGVATVVTKLFSIVGPCTAYFGRKDFQQLAVIRRLAADLSLAVDVVGCPLVREADGVAMSSRNSYLNDRERDAATVLFRSLRAGVAEVEAGERDPATLRRVVANVITAEQRVRLEYAEVLDADDLSSVETLAGDIVVAVAARVGPARLIDNVTLHVEGDAVTADLGVIAGSDEE